MSLMSVIRVARQQLKDHVDLVPLAVILASTGTLSLAAMTYTSVAKNDVIYNRWWNPMPWMHNDPTKAQQKLFVFSKKEKETYSRDRPLEGLRNQIYSDGRYMSRPKIESGH